MRICLISIFVLFSFITSNSSVDAEPDYYAAAMKAYQEKDYAGCISNLQKLVKADDATPSRVMYNLACAYALSHQPEQALLYLKKVADRGLSFPADQDPDFASIKDKKAFRAIQDQFAQNLIPTNRSEIFVRTPESDFLAEGVAYDPATETFYSGSIKLRKIVSFDSKGNFHEFSSADDQLYPVLGLTLDPARQRLWAATASPVQSHSPDRGKSALVEYDLESRKLLHKYPVPHRGDHGLGDVIVSSSGNIFSTDSNSGAIYWIPSGKDAMETFIPEGKFRSPQGLCFTPDQKQLLIADYSTGISRIDLQTREIQHLPAPPSSVVEGIDGLYLYRGNLVATQNGVDPRRVLLMTLDQKISRIEKVEVLESGNSAFGEPTLGVIVGDSLYFVANNPAFGDLLRDPKTELRPSIILKLALKK